MDAVQNSRELLRLASPSQEYHRDYLIQIQQAHRTIHVDCRPCTAQELAAHSSLFALPVTDQNRWIHNRLQTSSLSEDFSARQPQPSSIPKVTLTPGVSKFWKAPIRRPVLPEGTILEVVFIAIVQGSGGNAVRKIIVANAYPQIATSVFNEAVNGYSIVFTGACLKRELEKARNHGPNSLAVVWRKVITVDQMLDVRARAKPKDQSEKLTVSMLC